MKINYRIKNKINIWPEVEKKLLVGEKLCIMYPTIEDLKFQYNRKERIRSSSSNKIDFIDNEKWTMQVAEYFDQTRYAGGLVVCYDLTDDNEIYHSSFDCYDYWIKQGFTIYNFNDFKQ